MKIKCATFPKISFIASEASPEKKKTLKKTKTNVSRHNHFHIKYSRAPLKYDSAVMVRGDSGVPSIGPLSLLRDATVSLTAIH